MDTATDQIENSLTSLMKAKFGVTRSSSVKLTEKDTLYTIFRKLADNIYKNGTWTQEDEIQAVDTLIRNRNNFSIDTENIKQDKQQVSEKEKSTEEEIDTKKGWLANLKTKVWPVKTNS